MMHLDLIPLLLFILLFPLRVQGTPDGSVRCEFDPVVLAHLNRTGLLDPTYYDEQESNKVVPPPLLKRRYSAHWDYKDTCWLAEQLLVTEALGGQHPFCNNHAQNRNLLYLLTTKAGSMRPATEAVQQMGYLLRKDKYNYTERTEMLMADSYQLEQFFPNVELIKAEKDRMLGELRGKGLSVFPRSMKNDWLDRLTDKLKDKTFLEMTHGWTLKGLTPEKASDDGYSGTFMLHDLNDGLEINEIQKIAYDPFILDILQDLLGAQPVIRTVDVFMNVAREDEAETKFSFDSWHKDFNSARSVKVFVYLTNATDPKRGPHRYIPYTQDVMGPTFPAKVPLREKEFNRLVEKYGLTSQVVTEDYGGRRTARGPSFPDEYTNKEFNHLVEEFALSMSSQVLPEEYLKQNVFTQNEEALFGNAGMVWIEDTHIFHKADKNLEGWRGLLQIDYTATGYCGKDHAALHKPLSRIPNDSRTQKALQHSPRLFQRARVGEYARPHKEIIQSGSNQVLAKAQPLEHRFGSPLQYDETMQGNDPNDHTAYVKAGFKKSGNWSYSSEELPEAPCWEYECQRCLQLRFRGNCHVCSQLHVCTCSCDHAFSCDDDDSGAVTAATIDWQEFPVKAELQLTEYGSNSTLIPPVIYQYWYSLDPVPDGSDQSYNETHCMMNKWKSLEGFDYDVYDDESARSFLTEHFPPIVLEAYDILVPGSFKSDLFRYALLLIKGGIYVDNDLYYPSARNLELERILQRDKIGFFATVDQGYGDEGRGVRSFCLLSGLLATYPGHPVMAIALSRLVSQVLNRDTFPGLMRNLCPDPQTWALYELGHLYLTGPCLLGSAVNIALGRPPFSLFTPGDITSTEGAPFPLLGDIRLLQFDFVVHKNQHSLPAFKRNPKRRGRVMRRIHVGPDGTVTEITWSKLSDETPRTKENNHYGFFTHMVPRVHMYSRGVYNETNHKSDGKQSVWYDFAVSASSNASSPLPSYTTAEAPGRHGRLKRPEGTKSEEIYFSHTSLHSLQNDVWRMQFFLLVSGSLCILLLLQRRHVGSRFSKRILITTFLFLAAFFANRVQFRITIAMISS